MRNTQNVNVIFATEAQKSIEKSAKSIEINEIDVNVDFKVNGSGTENHLFFLEN